MKQQTVFKKVEVVLEEPKTLRSILEEMIKGQNLDLGLLETIKNHLIFSVDNVMERDISTEVKAGATVRLIPAVKAG